MLLNPVADSLYLPPFSGLEYIETYKNKSYSTFLKVAVPLFRKGFAGAAYKR